MRIVDVLEFCHGRAGQYFGETNNHWSLLAELVEELADAASEEIKQTYRFKGYEQWKNERYSSSLSTSKPGDVTPSGQPSVPDICTLKSEPEVEQKPTNGLRTN